MVQCADRPRFIQCISLLLILVHCAAQVHPNATARAVRHRPIERPVFARDLALEGRRIAAGAFETCAVLGARRELFCWGIGVAKPNAAPRIQIVGRKGPGERRPSRDTLLRPCTSAFGAEAVGTTPAPVWWAESDDPAADRHGRAQEKRSTARALDAVADVVLARDEGCALLGDGDAACWGLSPRDGSHLADVRISGAAPALAAALRGSTRLLSLGSRFCGLLGGAGVRCFDRALEEEHFDGLSDVIDLTGASDHRCALLASGSVYCWGDNDRGQLGVRGAELDRCIVDGLVRSCSERPVRVPLAAPVRQLLSIGPDCALLADGKLECWGRAQGTAAVGSQETYAPRALAMAERIKRFALGGQRGCAIESAGVRCYQIGANERGAAALRGEPESVPLTDVIELAVGASHVCAVRADRSVWCWGNNQRGQLGDGTCEDRATPVQVLPPQSVSPAKRNAAAE